MGLNNVPAGKDVPNDFNVIIEIPMRSDPVKYEVDKETGAVFVDRFMTTAMNYPCNYGYIPQTLSGDGDPVDVLVLSNYALPPGVVIRCRALGILNMTDEAGQDGKLIAVPHEKISPCDKGIQSLDDLPEIELQRIAHFFEHYKDLEKGKFVKVEGWGDKAAAHKEITDGVERYKAGK
ncbi:MAG TPA: inorganic diphosphatase [Rhodocyclaceae bacterium]|nr:inorganic diphosphatase [Rhodocyclaceae bacterium]